MANFYGSVGIPDGGLGSLLQQQTQDETDEERKRRLERQQAGMLDPTQRGGSLGQMAKSLVGEIGRAHV